MSDPKSKDRDAAEAAERKEKVLHARIPDSLDREIKERARNLGLSVSTIVRHVLLNTFDLVEDIVSDGASLAATIAGDNKKSGERSGSSRDGKRDAAVGDGEVIGWQRAVLNVNAVCASCNTMLAKGRDAAIGIGASAGAASILCFDCLDRLSTSGKKARRRVASGRARKRRRTASEGSNE